MAITDRNLKAGTKLVAKYHKQTHTCEVVEKDGKLIFRLEDGREFKSPSGAGMAVTGHACDGWHFWSVETTQAAPAPESPQVEAPKEPASSQTNVLTRRDITNLLNAAAEHAAEAAPAAGEPAPAKKRIILVPNQKGVPESKVRWFCRDCGQSFLAEPGETPQACPKGHKVA